MVNLSKCTFLWADLYVLHDIILILVYISHMPALELQLLVVPAANTQQQVCMNKYTSSAFALWFHVCHSMSQFSLRKGWMEKTGGGKLFSGPWCSSKELVRVREATRHLAALFYNVDPEALGQALSMIDDTRRRRADSACRRASRVV